MASPFCSRSIAGPACQISPKATPSNSKAARQARKKVAAKVPLFSLAVIEFSVSALNPCLLRRFANSAQITSFFPSLCFRSEAMAEDRQTPYALADQGGCLIGQTPPTKAALIYNI